VAGDDQRRDDFDPASETLAGSGDAESAEGAEGATRAEAASGPPDPELDPGAETLAGPPGEDFRAMRTLAEEEGEGDDAGAPPPPPPPPPEEEGGFQDLPTLVGGGDQAPPAEPAPGEPDFRDLQTLVEPDPAGAPPGVGAVEDSAVRPAQDSQASAPSDSDWSAGEATAPTLVEGRAPLRGAGDTVPGGPSEGEPPSSGGAGKTRQDASSAAGDGPSGVAPSGASAGPSSGAVAQSIPTRRQPSRFDVEGLASNRVGNYEIVRELGRGGMGVVYEAKHARTERPVALKVLPAGLVAANESLLDRFKVEGRAAGRLEHPNVVAVLDLDEDPDGGCWYLAMDLIQGEDLYARIKRDGPLDSQAAARLTLELCSGMKHAHERRVLHRDIKPHNVLLDSKADGRPLLTDFGLAKLLEDESIHLTQGNQLLGTPGFMSPEQAGAGKGPIDERADIYGLGANLYYSLTGRVPFPGKSVPQILNAVVSRAPTRPSKVRPGIDHDLETIVLKCLEKDPEDRYPSVADLEADLQRYLDQKKIVAKRPPAHVRALRWGRRNRGQAAGLIAAGLLVLGIVTFSVTTIVDRARREAQIEREIAAREAAAKKEADEREAEAERREAEAERREAEAERRRQREAERRARAEREQRAAERREAEEARRRRQAEEEARRLAMKPPVLEVVEPELPPDLRVAEPEQDVLVICPDDDVDEVTLDGEPLERKRREGEGGEPTYAYHGTWRLDEGDNESYVRAVDASGVATVHTLAAILDTTPPPFSVDVETFDPQVTGDDATAQKARLRIRLDAPDAETEPAAVSVRAQPEPLEPIVTTSEGEGAWSVEVPLQLGTNRIHVVVRDHLGNAGDEWLEVVREEPRIVRGAWWPITPAQKAYAIEIEQPVVRRDALGMVFVLVPPGTFVMGSPPDEDGREADEVPHGVRLSRGFYLSAWEVDNADYRRLVGDHAPDPLPSGWDVDLMVEDEGPVRLGGDDLPVTDVTWAEATAFCEALSAHQRERDGAGRFRLPTEAEWEYAARAGTTTPWFFGADQAAAVDYANLADETLFLILRDARDVTASGTYLDLPDDYPLLAPTGRDVAPNPFGLYDVHGNAAEWCQDFYAPYPVPARGEGPLVDPTGPEAGGEYPSHAHRGGGWDTQIPQTRAAARRALPTGRSNRSVGLRVVWEVEPE